MAIDVLQSDLVSSAGELAIAELLTLILGQWRRWWGRPLGAGRGNTPSILLARRVAELAIRCRAMFNAAMIRLAAFVIAIAVVGCGMHQQMPPKVVTIGSLTDAARRLELLGYRHDDDSHVLGQHFVNYKRETPDALYTVSIVRWEDDQRIKEVFFHCRTNFAVFDSREARHKILLQIDKDVCALIDGQDDYFRAQRDSHEVEGKGLARFEGRATTAEGWQIDFTEYIGYYVSGKDEKGSKLALAQVALSHVATKEDITPAAIIEFNRVMNQGKTKAD